MKAEGIKGESIKLIKYLNSILFLLFVSTPLQANSISSMEWGTEKYPFSYSQKRNIDINVEKKNERILIKRVPYFLNTIESLRSIHLSFEKEYGFKRSSLFPLKGNPNVIKLDYRKRRFLDSIGYAASFEKKEHKIWIKPPDDLFLNQNTFVDKFSVFLIVRPYILHNDPVIFQKTVFLGGKKYGIDCILKKGRVIFRFHHLFWRNSDSIPVIKIRSKERLKKNQFTKIMLRYQANNGKLTLFLDSKEQEVLYLTHDFLPQGRPMLLKFAQQDSSLIMIGKNFIGALDEIIFSNEFLPLQLSTLTYGMLKRDKNTFMQSSAEILSKRYSLSFSQSDLSKVVYRSYEPEGSRIIFYIRYADKFFPENATEESLPFIKLYSKKKKENFTELLTHSFLGVGKAKYFQWKAVLYPDPSGENSPVLEEVIVQYKNNPPPSSPHDLQLAHVDQNGITIQFLRNSEKDVLSGGRYHVYYGIQKDKPLGVIRYLSFKDQQKETINDIHSIQADDIQLQNLQISKNKIQVTINNEMIRKNMIYTSDKPPLIYEYPLLKENIPFYFWVTACDSSYTENPEHSDHESKPSNYIIVRSE